MSNETAFFATVLQEYDVLEDITLHPLSESSLEEGYLVYRIQRTDGGAWVARAYRRNHPWPDWFRFFYPWATSDPAEWLSTRAATLLCLEQQHYPAPRVLRTRTGALVSTTPAWCLLVTTFIEGTVLQPTLDQLRLFSATLGSLHTLSPDHTTPPGKSYWDTADAFSTVQAHLASVEDRLPAEWRTLHTAFSQTLQRLQQCPELPRTLIHGDAWAANTVQTPTGQILLIDWDTGGWGPAICDLGRLLLECHLDSALPPKDPLAWHIQPDEHRIAAVVDGYAQQRRLSPVELEMLLEALRFGIIFLGALHFTQALQGDRHSLAWVHGMQRRFARLQNRWEVSSAIASLARSRFEMLSEQKES